MTASEVIGREAEALSPVQTDLLEEGVARRLGGEPLAYILGEWDFRHLRLEVNPSVLIPRPETEELVEWVLASGPSGRWADVGTGSGAIALSLARERPGMSLWATDVSPGALAVARRNAVRCGVEDRVRFCEGDLWGALPAGLVLDGAAANLPYVDPRDIPALAAEVKREPRAALDGGTQGLAVISRLLSGARDRLKKGGCIFLETGYNQASAVARRMETSGFIRVDLRADASGVERFVGGVAA
jgi:release factor glutamine methyltransferase